MKMDSLFGCAVDVGLPVVLWRLPGDDKTRATIELSKTVSPTKIKFENNESGFAFGPFVNPGCNRTLLIHGDLCYNSLSDELTDGPRMGEYPEKEGLKNKFAQTLSQKGADGANGITRGHDNVAAPITQSEKDHYCQLVTDGIKAIKSGRFQKLVLSHTHVVPLSDDFSPVGMFTRLCKEYPGAFVYLLSIPLIGTWIGVTPETLVSLNKNNVLSTMALGGTVVIQSEGQPEPKWERKELDEHNFISQYIADCFQKVGVEKLTRNGPRTSTAGKLYHLKTDFSAQLDRTQAQQVVTNILDLLHPTPAVCGIPKDEATSFIIGNEGYRREFYTGFLGPVNIDNESHLFVNLRCMQLYKNLAILYSGAGVTRESDPVKEWEETQAKSGTLRGGLVS
jgi:isochorismate synthase